jgi:hypothetical protein
MCPWIYEDWKTWDDDAIEMGGCNLPFIPLIQLTTQRELTAQILTTPFTRKSFRNVLHRDPIVRGR